MSSAWSRAWDRLTSANPNLSLAHRAITQGKLFDAVDCAMRAPLDQSLAGRRLLHRLVDALLEQGNDEISAGKYPLAWKTLSAAARVALNRDLDRVSKETSELVELTIEQAEANLLEGKITQAMRLIEEVIVREIPDWRATQISETAAHLKEAERLSAAGDCDRCLERLRQAKSLRPDLAYLEARISTCQLRKTQISEFTKRLHKALLADDLGEVEKVCRQLLVIAPNFKTAQDAQRRILDIRKKRTRVGVGNTVYAGSANDSNKPAELPNQSSGEPSTRNLPVDNGEQPNSQAHEKTSEPTFMMWIDGVGGYLVCPAARNTIGQAVTQSNIQIPILGDLQRRHCRIETVERSHFLQPLGRLTVDGKKAVQPQQLRSDQVIELEGGVQLKYARPHPLSGSARLDFLSRHRTQPWADSVLLASGPLILGPDPRNHVYCPRWPWDLILFQRNGQWFARTRGKLEIDGVVYKAEGPFQLNSRINGEEFTISLEPVGPDNGPASGG
jgi:tetratricopeptide (TPR) repeat protein